MYRVDTLRTLSRLRAGYPGRLPNPTSVEVVRFFSLSFVYSDFFFTNYKIGLLHIIETCEKIQGSLCKPAYVFYCVFMTVYVMAQS